MRISSTGYVAGAFAVLCALLPAADARAECETIGIATCQGHVTAIILAPTYISIKTDSNENRLSSFCAADGDQLRIPRSNPVFNEFLAMLLAAKLSGHSMEVRVLKATDGKCEVGYLTME